MALRAIIISPPRKTNSFEFSDSGQELVLKPFCGKPTVDFGEVKVKSRVEVAIKLINPHDRDLQVNISKAPDTFTAETKFVVPAKETVQYNVVWTPKEEGNVRKALNVSAVPSKPPIRTDILLVGKAVDPSKGPEWKRAAMRGSTRTKPPAKKPEDAKKQPVQAKKPDEPKPTAVVAATKKPLSKPAATQLTKSRGIFTRSKVPTVAQSSSFPDESGDVSLLTGGCETFIAEPADATFVIPPPPAGASAMTGRTPRETFVVGPQLQRDAKEAARIVSRANSVGAASNSDEDKENAAPPKSRFKFPNAMYRKRQSSTPVTSPGDRHGSLKLESSRAGLGEPNKSPVSRFAANVSHRLGAMRRSKSLRLSSSPQSSDGPDEAAKETSPSVMITNFKKRLQEMRQKKGKVDTVAPVVLKSEVKVEEIEAGMVEIDLNEDADISTVAPSELSLLSTIASPGMCAGGFIEPPLDDIEEEANLSEFVKSPTPPKEPTPKKGIPLHMKLRKFFDSETPKPKEEIIDEDVETDFVPRPIKLELDAEEPAASAGTVPESLAETKEESTLENSPKAPRPDNLMVIVPRRELSALRIQAWWFRIKLAQASGK